ncbi:MAG: hypothetical protein ACPGU1_18175 [Myxococcota bacterium]
MSQYSLLSRPACLFLAAVAGLMGCSEDTFEPAPTEATDASGASGTTIDIIGAPTGDGQGTMPDGPGRAAPCVSDAECVDPATPPGECRAVLCDLPSGLCLTVNFPDGASCDDGLGCTTEDACLGGACVGSERLCLDDNPCTAGTCDEASDACVFTPVEAPCDDGQLCTLDDRCEGGACVGAPNPACACVPGTDDCAAFDDGDLCNGSLTCVDALCVSDGASVVCPEDVAGGCETLLCDPADGVCKGTPKPNGVPCADGDACTQGDLCNAGQCEGGEVFCEDGNPCTSDGCDAATGCFHLPAPGACDDGDLCTTDDTCVDGACAGVDNPECSCTQDADCAVYEDGNLCNGTLRCTNAHCVVDSETVVSCDAVADGLAACQEVSCVPTTGNCVVKASLNGTPCNDESVCTTTDYCLSGQCTGLSPGCDDGDPCTSDACDPEAGCGYGPLTGVACDDQNACTVGDSCVDGVCGGANDPGCQCFEDADCDEFDDGDLCNGTLRCQDNSCMVNPATVVTCEAASGDPCTQSVCVPQTGGCATGPVPEGTPCDDTNACTTADHCASGQCIGGALSCDDGDVCTADACDPELGCTYSYNVAFCDDGNDCTYLDTCVWGFCAGVQEEDCVCTVDADCADFEDDDLCNGTLSCQGNKCVVDPESVIACATEGAGACSSAACDPETGACVSTQANDGKPCDDLDACSSGDVCSGGACVGASALDCSDGKPCTADLCQADTGCYNPPLDNGASCDDGDSCTAGDACFNGGCLPGSNTCGDSQCQAQDTLGCGDSDDWGTGFFDGEDVIEGYNCAPGQGYPGNDYVYYFEAPYDGLFDVSLGSETGLTEVFILAQTGSGCDPGSCVDTGYAYGLAAMSKGEGFYVVVDSPEDASSEYVITIDCLPEVEAVCDDGVDEDADGEVDCDDTDCQAAAACTVGQCTAAQVVTCGDIDSSTTYGVGAGDALDGFEGCGNPFDYAGTEYVYAFTAPLSTTVTVTLTDETSTTDIMVLSETCDAAACLTYGYDGVGFEAVAGQTYYLVVDGFAGQQGAFTISVACEDEGPPQETESCEGGVDEDGDGAVDCLDSDCVGVSPFCQPSCGASDSGFALICDEDSDAWNNGGLGSTDVVDSYPSCFDTGLYTGPEYVYSFTAEADGAITILKTEADDANDLDMFVLADEGLGCNPASCLEWGTESVTFLATNGTSYFIVIDGWEGAINDYELAFSCGD